MLNCVCYEHWCRHPPQTFPETASETTWQHLTLSSLQVKILSVHLFCSKWASLRQFFERKNAGKSWRSLWTVTIYIFLAPSVSTDTMGWIGNYSTSHFKRIAHDGWFTRYTMLAGIQYKVYLASALGGSGGGITMGCPVVANHCMQGAMLKSW